jgi:stage IV sporulation protein FB
VRLGWQDRDYYRGSGGGAGDYLVNPSNILGLSVPFGTWFGVRIRLHFWLLLLYVFLLSDLFRQGTLLVIGIDFVLILAALLLHDFGHRVATHLVGGEHNEFMLWPAGGMVFPMSRPGPWPTFVSYIGGVVANLIFGAACYATVHGLTGAWIPLSIRDPVMSLGGAAVLTSSPPDWLLYTCLGNLVVINWGLVIVNLLPYFWFDGGFLWRTVLQPLTGATAALNITCIVGMILAVPMFFIALSARDLLMLCVWAFLFSSAYTARTQMMPEEGEQYAASLGDSAGVSGRIRSGRWPSKSMARAQAKRRREEQKIDAILAKVSAHGMHSLTWLEKRTLKKGSERLK